MGNLSLICDLFDQKKFKIFFYIKRMLICRLDKKFQFVDWTNQKIFQLKKNYRLFNRLIKTEL